MSSWEVGSVVCNHDFALMYGGVVMMQHGTHELLCKLTTFLTLPGELRL